LHGVTLFLIPKVIRRCLHSRTRKEHEFILSDTQPRLHYALEQVLSPGQLSFMLLKAPEEAEYLTLLGDACASCSRKRTPFLAASIVSRA
jgi:hypothetical protein